jgi:hypothetical protein
VNLSEYSLILEVSILINALNSISEMFNFHQRQQRETSDEEPVYVSRISDIQ